MVFPVETYLTLIAVFLPERFDARTNTVLHSSYAALITDNLRRLVLSVSVQASSKADFLCPILGGFVVMGDVEVLRIDHYVAVPVRSGGRGDGGHRRVQHESSWSRLIVRR